MRVVLQRVSEASVVVDGCPVGEIGRGILLLAAISGDDDDVSVKKMAEKCLNLRVFPEGEGHFELSVTDIGGEILAVSQFTLYGDCRKGRRPSLSGAARPEAARKLFDRFVEALREDGVRVETGTFGALMQVGLQNDGPVTFLIDT